MELVPFDSFVQDLACPLRQLQLPPCVLAKLEIRQEQIPLSLKADIRWAEYSQG
jgi:hypothetical protein